MNHGAARGSRLLGLAALLILLNVPDADAYRVRLAWRPVAGAAGYKLYARQNGFPTAASIDLGGLAAGSDGVIRYEHSGLLVESTNAFALAAYNASGVESPHSNELAIGYAIAATIVDSDGDGLTDAREDANLNLTRDAGETDRQLADTDGDGASDGIEVAAGSDPLNAASRPGGPTPTRTATLVHTATPTQTASPSRTPTRTPAPVATSTATRAITPTPRPTASPTATPAPTGTPRPTSTPAPTGTSTPTSRPPPLPTATPVDSGSIDPPTILGVERID